MENMDWKSLEQQSERWQEHEEELLAIKRSLHRDARSVRYVFETAEQNRLVFKNRLFFYFGVKTDTMKEVEGFKPPLTLRGKKDLILSGVFYEFYSGVLEVREDLLKRRSEDVTSRYFPKFRRSFPDMEDSYEWAARKVVHLFEELVAVFHEIWSFNRDLLRTRRLKPRERRHARELMNWANERIAAWMDTQVNTNVNRRIRDSLEETRRGTGRSQRQEKLVELAKVTPMAFKEREEGEPIRPGSGKRSVVSRVSGARRRDGKRAGAPSRTFRGGHGHTGSRC